VKDVLRELVLERSRARVDPRNLAREYLQARVLGSLQRAGAMMAIAFHGVTALRFLYGLPRFSEDLDFSLEDPHRGFDIREALRRIRSGLEAEGYRVDPRVKTTTAVHSGFIKFPGLLHELGLSPRREETLRIKLEVDTNPPEGAGLETTLVRRFETLRLYHHDRPSLLAGKLHAILQRPWTKGRDLFDLLWYLSDPEWPPPNLVLLNNALLQTGWDRDAVTPDNWRVVVRERIEGLDWGRVFSDVQPFVEPRADIDLLTRENLLSVL
jgi:hypothetical protein